MRLNKIEPLKIKKNNSVVKKPKKPFCKIKIKCYMKRRIDYDNLWGGVKQLIDAMSNEGFIFDDCFTYLDTALEQIKSKEFKNFSEILVYFTRIGNCPLLGNFGRKKWTILGIVRTIPPRGRYVKTCIFICDF